jgi:hypothetical protein
MNQQTILLINTEIGNMIMSARAAIGAQIGHSPKEVESIFNSWKTGVSYGSKTVAAFFHLEQIERAAENIRQKLLKEQSK